MTKAVVRDEDREKAREVTGMMFIPIESERLEHLNNRVAQALADQRHQTAMEIAEWRPIDSAPKDGTRILLAKIVGHPDHETALWWVVLGHWSDRWKNWNDGVEPSGLADPTHWMPAPRRIRSKCSPTGKD